MSDKKPNKPKPQRHGKMIRLPDELHQRLLILAQRNKRPLSWEVKIMVEDHLKQNGA